MIQGKVNLIYSPRNLKVLGCKVDILKLIEVPI